MIPAAAKLREWRASPAKFVYEELHATPDRWQEKALQAFADPTKQRIALKACAGPGKSAVLAWFAWHFLTCQGEKDHHPNGAAVSVTEDNLKDNLWKELAVWRGRSEFLTSQFEWTKERIFLKAKPATWFISARTWSKKADAETQGRTLSGLHSKYLLYLIDESGDISPAVLRAAEQGMSNVEWGKIAQAGNPTSHSGILYASVVTQSHIWVVITITGDPDNPDRSTRISKDWAEEQIRLYGRDNPWVVAYILGEFPPSSLNVLLGPEEVQAAMGRHLPEDTYIWSQKRLGIDVARFGDDRSVIFPRQGLAAFTPVVMKHQRTTDIAARVAMAKAKWNSEMEFVDDSGHWGHGVIDNLIAAGHSPVPVFFEDKAIDPRYFNKRAEMWMTLAEWVKRGGSLPNLPELVRELTAPTYTFAQGKFRLEPKDQIKARLGYSPDLGDALALTFAQVDQPTSHGMPAYYNERGNHAKTEWDPFAEERT